MIELNLLHGKKIGIFGLSRTGVAAYKGITGRAREILCYDENEINRNNFTLQFPSAQIIKISDEKWTKLNSIVVSPGIPHSHEIFAIAESNNIELTSDIDLLFKECSQKDFICITGTNGKSTTTALISHILKSNGLDYPMGGNIGNAALNLHTNAEGYVLELSSYQLELIKDLRAKISILLNITPDHLDRHKTMDNYINAKIKLIASPIAKQYSIICIDNPITREIYQSLNKNTNNSLTIIPVSSLEQCSHGISMLKDRIYDNMHDHTVTSVQKIPNTNKSLQGDHNKQNIAAAYAACRLIGLTPKEIALGIMSFSGLPHRMQYVGSTNNIEMYNDSKATNADAASKSIAALDNIFWLAGGIAKTGGIESLKPLFSKIKKAYLFGADKLLFANSLRDQVEFCICNDMNEAFELAFNDALNYNKTRKKHILLAPAASSLDQFDSFEERGDVFTNISTAKLNAYAQVK